MLLSSFTATPEGYKTEIDEEVAILLQRLLGETITVLDAPDQESFVGALLDEDRRDEPEDPTLRVLLPPMSFDPEEAQTLRALTEDTLRSQKAERLLEIGHAISQIALDENREIIIPFDKVWAWLSGFNDLRLVLAQRLQVGSAADNEYWFDRAIKILHAPRHTPLEITHEELIGLVFVMVSWWQDSLLEAVHMGGPPTTL
ncbi:MAG: DUF2017 family protein [Actinomycetaceae bacterium]|nr:DUF2017 family protein [Actinomycetaceae bacterium]